MMLFMATNMRQIQRDGKKAEVAAGITAVNPSQNEGPVFSLIERFRLVILTSPLWLASIELGLHAFGDQRIRAAIDFLNGLPQK